MFGDGFWQADSCTACSDADNGGGSGDPCSGDPPLCPSDGDERECADNPCGAGCPCGLCPNNTECDPGPDGRPGTNDTPGSTVKFFPQYPHSPGPETPVTPLGLNQVILSPSGVTGVSGPGEWGYWGKNLTVDPGVS